jgi:predicted ATPase
MARALHDHDDIVRMVVEANGGRLVKSKGEGDSTFSVFDVPEAAVAAATEVVTRLGSWSWPPGGLLVRAGLHTGGVDERDGDWFGPVVNRAARIRALAANAGVLCSDATAALVRDALPEGVELLDVGEQFLLGLRAPERVWAVISPQLPIPLLTAAPRRAIIEMPRTTLVGRDSDLDAVVALVRRHRLVTLVGGAGTGKTRLAREVASRVPVPGGARLIELADVRDAAAVEGAVFKTITVEEGGFRQSRAGLADTEVLLVVDNCEHVVEAAADALRALLAATVQVRVLATTREALALTAEVVYPVKPLALPSLRAAELAEVMTTPAVRLFVDRAQAVRPGLVVGDSDRRTLVEIARLLDGVPLAIELAAAGLASAGLGDLERQLHSDLVTLVDHRRDADRRHRSLQAALDWSHGSATGEERVVFRRLSTFARFRADDAVAVVGQPEERSRVLAALRSLVSKSLVVLEDCDGEAAYRLLQPVRLYAGGWLRDAGEVEAFTDRHALHTARAAIDAGRRYFTDQPSVVAKLHFAAGDLELSLQRLLSTGRYSLAADVIGSLALYWFFNDQPSGRRWADRASAEMAQLDERRRLGLHFARGLLHHSGTEVGRSVADLEAAVDGYQRLGRRRAEAASRFWLARALFLAGRQRTEYDSLFQSGAALADELGDPVLGAWCRLWLAEPVEDYWKYRRGELSSFSGEYADRLAKIIEQAQQAGARHPIGHACARLGRLELARGDYVAARKYCNEAVAIYRDLDHRWQLAEQLHTRALIALAADDLLSAALDVTEGTALSLEIGEERAIARGAEVLREYALATGHPDIAHRLASAYHAFLDRLTDKSVASLWLPPPRPGLASILAAAPIDEACRAALAKLFA